MTTIPFWSVATLVSDSEAPLDFQVSLEDMVSETGRLVDGELSHYSAKGTPFTKGDILFGKLRPYLAKYWLADREGTAGGDIHVYRPEADVEPRYLAYIVGSRNFVRFAEAASKGVKMPRAEWMSLREYPITEHEPEAQRAIADYLDRETGEIDAMIAKMDELAETLGGRRQAVIVGAVLGIAPNEQARETKRSTLPWVDRIPADWDERTLGTVTWVRARLGWKGLTASEYVDSGVPMLATPDIKQPVLDFASAARITDERFDESPEIKLSIGDVLLTKDGATIGIVNVVRDLPEPATVNGSIAVITPNDGLDSTFLYWVIASTYAQSIFRQLQSGMGVPHLFQRDINRIRIPVPSLAEQRRIADHLDEVTGKIDVMLAKVAELKALLIERRAALITDVVTGRKKVA